MPQVAEGSTLVFDSDVAFSGSTPGGPGPWLRATFDDAAAGAEYDVRLTLEALSLTGNEFIRNWAFSLNPAINPTQLTFADVNVAAVGDVLPTPTTGTDHWQADGDGKYDVHFAVPDGQHNNNRFKDG